MRAMILLLTFAIAAIFLSACTFVIDPSQIETKMAVATAPALPVMESATTVPRISVEDAKWYFDNGTALFVDARGMSEYDQAHIEGAISATST